MSQDKWKKSLHSAAIEAIDASLAEGEEVRVVILGAGNQAIIATDRRAMVFKKGFLAGASFGSELTSWAYRNLVGVQIHTGMLTGAVVLQGPGQAGTKTSYWKDSDSDAHRAPNAIPLGRPFDAAKAGVAELTKLMDAAHRGEPRPAAGARPEGAPTGGESIADELRKLADLHDAGVLSDDEFGALKAKMLAR